MQKLTINMITILFCVSSLVFLSFPVTARELSDVQDLTQAPFPVLFLESPAITVDGDFSDWPEVIPAVLDHDSQIIAGNRTPQTGFSGRWTFGDAERSYQPIDGPHLRDAVLLTHKHARKILV